MDLTERLRAWSHGRQCLTRPADEPEEALGAVIAVYSVHPTAPLALAARTRPMAPVAFVSAYRALDHDRTALRVPAMRMSMFLVPRDTAARIFTATRRSPAVAAKRASSIGLSPEKYERLAQAVLALAQEPLPQGAFQEATGLKGAALGRLLRTLRIEGRLVGLGGDKLRTGDVRYVRTERWTPEGLDAGGRDEELAWLAGEYLRVFGPARVEDFAWWAGVSRRAAAAAVEKHETVDVGDGLRLPAADEPAFNRVRRLAGTLDLLPMWDSYTMGYAPDGRARLVEAGTQSRVYTTAGDRSPGGTSGDARPVVLLNGVAAATWDLTVKDGATVVPFAPLGRDTRRRLDERLEQLRVLLLT